MSDNFDLKKYLVENKVTTNSKMLNEYFEKESDSLEQAFQKAGIDMSKPITTVKISGHTSSPGYETDDSMQVDPKSFLKKLEVEKAELEEEEGEAVIYDYDAADSYPAEDMNLPSTMVPKLSVMFSDSYEYVIYQGEGMTETKKKHSEMMNKHADKIVKEAMHGGYLEIFEMNPTFEEGVANLLQAWNEWKSGEATEPYMVEEAKQDILAYLTSMMK